MPPFLDARTASNTSSGSLSKLRDVFHCNGWTSNKSKPGGGTSGRKSSVSLPDYMCHPDYVTLRDAQRIGAVDRRRHSMVARSMSTSNGHVPPNKSNHHPPLRSRSLSLPGRQRHSSSSNSASCTSGAAAATPGVHPPADNNVINVETSSENSHETTGAPVLDGGGLQENSNKAEGHGTTASSAVLSAKCTNNNSEVMKLEPQNKENPAAMKRAETKTDCQKSVESSPALLLPPPVAVSTGAALKAPPLHCQKPPWYGFKPDTHYYRDTPTSSVTLPSVMAKLESNQYYPSNRIKRQPTNAATSNAKPNAATAYSADIANYSSSFPSTSVKMHNCVVTPPPPKAASSAVKSFNNDVKTSSSAGSVSTTLSQSSTIALQPIPLQSFDLVRAITIGESNEGSKTMLSHEGCVGDGVCSIINSVMDSFFSYLFIKETAALLVIRFTIMFLGCV